MTASRLAASALAALVALAPAAAAAQKESKEAKAKKPRIAILDFPTAAGGSHCAGWGNNEARMSNVLQELFTTEIFEKGKGKLRIVERDRLKDIRSELSFQQSGEVEGATAQKIGKLLGARWILTGKITRFACKKSELSTGWGVGALVGKLSGSGLAGSVAGSVNTANVKFSGRLDARVIDVESGEVVAVFKDESETGDTSVKIAGGGSEIDYDDELANKVFEPIVERMAPQIVKKTVRAQVEADDEE